MVLWTILTYIVGFFAVLIFGPQKKQSVPKRLYQQTVVVPSESTNGEAKSQTPPTETPVRRCPNSFLDHQDVKSLFEFHNLWDMFRICVDKYPSKNCLGTRTEGGSGPYEWKTYEQAGKLVRKFSSGLRALGANHGDRIGVYMKNREEWTISEYACYAQSLVLVALYDALGEDVIEYMINHPEIQIVIASSENLSKVLTCVSRCPTLKHIVVVDEEEEALVALQEDLPVTLHTWKQVLKLGGENAFEPITPSPDDLASIMYTSGTTGSPKGVMISHLNAVASLYASGLRLRDVMSISLSEPSSSYSPFSASFFENPYEDHGSNSHSSHTLSLSLSITSSKSAQTHTYLSYLPLAHVFERISLALSLCFGSSIGYYQGDVVKILQDIQALHPSIFIGAPRVFERIYQKITMSLMLSPNSAIGAGEKNEYPSPKSATNLKQFLFLSALRSRKNILERKKGLVAENIATEEEETQSYSQPRSKERGESYLENVRKRGEIIIEDWERKFWNKLVFNQFRSLLGGKVCGLFSGSAPISPDVQDFLAICFDCPVLQGYGLTETTAGATVTYFDDVNFGHVGAPLACCEIKLVNVEDMRYLVTDKPYARGEICIRGLNVTKGYYKEPEISKQNIDADGWLHTGDIGQINGDGSLSIIDRKKNIFKLSQGEYVAAEKLESIYSLSHFIQQLFVHGDSSQFYLVAIIVPDPSALRWAEQNKIPAASLADLCRNKAFEEAVLSDLNDKAVSHKLRGFEKIKKIYLTPELWTPQNDLLTPSLKLKRLNLRKRFAAEIERMYRSKV